MNLLMAVVTIMRLKRSANCTHHQEEDILMSLRLLAYCNRQFWVVLGKDQDCEFFSMTIISIAVVPLSGNFSLLKEILGPDPQ